MTDPGMPNLTQSRRAAHRSPIPHQGEEQLARLCICLAESDKADLRPRDDRRSLRLVREARLDPVEKGGPDTLSLTKERSN